MKQDLLGSLRAAIVALLAFSVLTGLIYPVLVLGVARAGFSHQARGSLIEDHGIVVGSELIGQAFTDARYFWGRPSAIGSAPYDASTSTGTNLGPNNPALHDAVAARIKALRDTDPTNATPVPVDLVTSSASGLDPHISAAAAAYQVARVARSRGVPVARVQAIVDAHVEGRTFGILGEPRVNVLALDRDLDANLGPPR